MSQSTIKVFQDLIITLEKNVTYCNWVKEKKVAGYIQGVKEELKELEEGISQNNIKNIHEEMGDLLYVTLTMLTLAKKEYKFDLAEEMQNIINKLKRRKPYIFENRSVSTEEAERIWQDAKKKEKGHN